MMIYHNFGWVPVLPDSRTNIALPLNTAQETNSKIVFFKLIRSPFNVNNVENSMLLNVKHCY